MPLEDLSVSSCNALFTREYFVVWRFRLREESPITRYLHTILVLRLCHNINKIPKRAAAYQWKDINMHKYIDNLNSQPVQYSARVLNTCGYPKMAEVLEPKHIAAVQLFGIKAAFARKLHGKCTILK